MAPFVAGSTGCGIAVLLLIALHRSVRVAALSGELSCTFMPSLLTATLAAELPGLPLSYSDASTISVSSSSRLPKSLSVLSNILYSSSPPAKPPGRRSRPR